MNTLNEKCFSNDKRSWVRVVYEAIENADISDEDGSLDEVNTAMAWICEELKIDPKYL